MKNLLNCHSKGLHSFPVSNSGGLYKRIFYASSTHNLHRPFEIAIHPHHVDIKITVLEGILYNELFEISEKGAVFKKFLYHSPILEKAGYFEHIGQEKLDTISSIKYKEGDVIEMKACELHTVYIPQSALTIWLIEEALPTCEYIAINYSPHDLTKWNSEGLYQETSDYIRNLYVGDFIKKLNL